MAFLDVTDVLRDPDFSDLITIVKRDRTINEYGEIVLSPQEGIEDYAVVQGTDPDDLELLPDSARVHNSITVFYAGDLSVSTDTTYADTIIWKGKEYQVSVIREDWENFGAGYIKAICTRIEANA